VAIEGERVTLRPLQVADAAPLAAAGSHPEIARWWPDITEEELVAKAEGRDDVEAFAIEHEGELAGLIQFWENPDEEYRYANIDLFLAVPFQGRGLGRDAVRTLARWLVTERGHHRLTIDPTVENDRAIRCYEAAGFRRVGVMRQYERDPAGGWRDGLLLDLLADELS
jgi:aminoglycoside 6'-N-acetyltransferase